MSPELNLMSFDYQPISLLDPANQDAEMQLLGATYNLGKPLDGEELTYFNAQFPQLVAGSPTSVERSLMFQRAGTYLRCIRATKEELNGGAFRGINPQDTEIGFGLLRPQFTQLAGVYKPNWNSGALLANAWSNFASNAAGVGYVLPNTFGVVISHAVSEAPVTPLVSEIKGDVGRGDIIPFDLRPLLAADNNTLTPIFPIPTLFAPPNGTLWVRVKFDLPGADVVRLGGLVIGRGRVLNELVPAW
jgi:hypothetical protein